jgi:hypothetical protein
MSHFYLHQDRQANRGYNEIYSYLLACITNQVYETVNELYII